jgi:hypothetical protein
MLVVELAAVSVELADDARNGGALPVSPLSGKLWPRSRTSQVRLTCF